jgi:transposase
VSSKPAQQMLSDVLGEGIITASIIATDIGDGKKGYASGRDYAASLGVVPKHHSSGDKQVYLGVSKRGNRYIRKMLIHSARSVLKLSRFHARVLERLVRNIYQILTIQ